MWFIFENIKLSEKSILISVIDKSTIQWWGFQSVTGDALLFIIMTPTFNWAGYQVSYSNWSDKKQKRDVLKVGSSSINLLVEALRSALALRTSRTFNLTGLSHEQQFYSLPLQCKLTQLDDLVPLATCMPNIPRL